jgi:hypothetical protein
MWRYSLARLLKNGNLSSHAGEVLEELKRWLTSTLTGPPPPTFAQKAQRRSAGPVERVVRPQTACMPNCCAEANGACNNEDDTADRSSHFGFSRQSLHDVVRTKEH